MKSTNRGIYKNFIKRFIDLIISFVALIILSPLFLIIGVLVRGKLGKPIIFKHKRPGKNEEIFTMYKFRTMTDKRDSKGHLLPNEKRHTPFGKFLRSTSLDELPGLINVLNGSMSLVGPRPLLTEYLPLYNEKHKRRHDVKPGLSGLAQVNGRNAIEWEKKFEYDLEYVEKVSLILDLKIIILTLLKVIRRENVNSSEAVTMKKFTGS
jgi:lipopolysaccharide/colanic/teichoic acid biosynthesis glycosyltransferase